MSQMTVSLVGRMTYSSSSRLSGSGTTFTLPPDSTCLRRWCVTIAHSLAKPSTCSASRARKLLGISSGKYALTCPSSLNFASRVRWMFSQMA